MQVVKGPTAALQEQQQQQHQKRLPLHELVPVQLTLGMSSGTLQEWLLWPVSSTTKDLCSFSEGLVRDLGMPLHFRGAIAETIRAQVADWVASVPPPTVGAGPRRELVRLDVVLGASLRLRDQFWWDLHAATPTPEEFAAELCADAGIDACHGAKVASAIRIELGKLRRAPPANLQLPTPRILDTAAAHGSAAQDVPGDPADENRGRVHADSCLRGPEVCREWGPVLHHLSAKEVWAMQKQQEAAVQQQLREQQQQQQLAMQRQMHEQQQQQQQQGLRQPEMQEQQQQVAQQLQHQQQTALERAGSNVKQVRHEVAAGALQQQGTPGLAGQQATRPLPPPLQQQESERRQLQPRRGRASRMKQLLQQEGEQEEQEGAAEEEGSRLTSGSGNCAEEHGHRSKGKARAREGVRGGGGDSIASLDYQPDEEALVQDAMLEAEEQKEVRQSQRAVRKRQRRRTPGTAGAAAGSQPHARIPTAAAGQQRQRQQQALSSGQALPTPPQQAVLSIQLPRSGSTEAPPLLGHGIGPGSSAGFPPLGMDGNATGTGLLSSSASGRLVGSSLDGGNLLSMLRHPQHQQHHHHQQQQLPTGMVPTPGGPSSSMMQLPLLSSQQSLPHGLLPSPSASQLPGTEQMQAVRAAIVHFARELNVGEHKVRVMLSRTPHEQLALSRKLQQLVQQARSRQREQVEAALLGAQAHQGAVAAGLPRMQGSTPVPDMLPPMSMPAAIPSMQQSQQQVGQFANLFSEMFDG